MKYLIATNDGRQVKGVSRERVSERDSWWKFEQMASCSLLYLLKCFSGQNEWTSERASLSGEGGRRDPYSV